MISVEGETGLDKYYITIIMYIYETNDHYAARGA